MKDSIKQYVITHSFIKNNLAFKSIATNQYQNGAL